MANITELLNKNLEPIFQKLGKISLNGEKILGVAFKDNEIQLIELIYKKKIWQVKDYTYQQIAGIGKDQDIYSASTYLSDQIKNCLDSIDTKTKDVAITLGRLSSTIYNLQIPLMDPKDLAETVSLGGFWEQFDETPESLEEFETSYQIISSNEELGVMNVTLVTIEKKLVEAYVNIFRLAGLNPIIIDINPASQINALYASLGKEGFDSPVAIFNYSKDNSYLTVASNKGLNISDINIVEADQVLLDTIEDIEDVTTEFWDEIFDRLASQIKQGLVEFETQHECEPISLINVVTDKSKTKNLFTGLEKQLGEVVIKTYDPEESITFGDDEKKYLDALPNKSKTINCIGVGLRKLNAYNVANENQMYDFNLLPRAEQLKVNRKANSFSKYCFIMSFLIFFFGGIHLVAGSLFKILDNSSEISKLAGITQDVQSKEQLIQAFQGKVGRVNGQVTTSNYFGENKKTTAELIASLSSNVPKNVRLTKFEISDKRQVEIDGIAKDDQSIIQMIDKFSESETVKEAKLNNVVNFTEEDRKQLYSERGKPAPKTFPNEDITKKFSATIAMAPVEGEKFDNFKVLDKIMKKKR
jgi:type IV pilus assembly protein PilN